MSRFSIDCWTTPMYRTTYYEDSFEEVLDRVAVHELLSNVRDWSQRLMADA